MVPTRPIQDKGMRFWVQRSMCLERNGVLPSASSVQPLVCSLSAHTWPPSPHFESACFLSVVIDVSYVFDSRSRCKEHIDGVDLWGPRPPRPPRGPLVYFSMEMGGTGFREISSHFCSFRRQLRVVVGVLQEL